MQEYIEFFQAHPILTIAWVVLAVLVVVSFVKSRFSKVQLIGHQEAVLLMNKQDAKVIDVREKGEFRKKHILKAINVQMAEIKNNQLSTIEKFKTTPIIVVCNAGITSSQAAQLLVKNGFEQVYNLKGGMSDWQSANMPVSK